MATYGSDLLDKLKTNKEKDGNEILKEQTEGALVGSAIGLFLGLYLGYSRNYNLLFSGFIGAMAGGLISRTLISKK